MSSNDRGPSPAGFTLIEILVVITVIAILASLVTPMVFRNVARWFTVDCQPGFPMPGMIVPFRGIGRK